MSASRSNYSTASGAERVRLTFGVEIVHGSTIDATWWPRTTTFVDDLPPLIVALREHGVRITAVAYSPALWGVTPERVYADGRTIRLTATDNADPDVLLLEDRVAGQRLTVLVVAPPPAGSRKSSTAAA